MADDGTCKHAGCNCPVTGDGEYCSDYCSTAEDQDMTEIACGCGHASCG